MNMTDIEIARSTKLEKIVDVAKKLGMEEDDIEQYGKYKAKITDGAYEKRKVQKNGKYFTLLSATRFKKPNFILF